MRIHIITVRIDLGSRPYLEREDVPRGEAPIMLILQ